MRKLIAFSVLVLAITIGGVTSTAQASVASSKSLIRAWFPGNATAWGTACRESKFQERAVGYDSNNTYDSGLFQINSIHIGTHVHYYSPSQRKAVDITIGYVRTRHGSKWVGSQLLLRPKYNVMVTWAMSRGGTNWVPWNGGTTYCSLGYK